MRFLSAGLERKSTMRLKKFLLLGGVAAIPAWYVYRTVADNRVPRLEWNEIFMTEDQRLRKELEATKKKAQEDIEKIQEENSIESRRLKAENEIRGCIELSKRVRVDFDAFVAEENRWKSEVEPLLHTRAGAAIVANEDYVRAFKEFHRNPLSDEHLKADADEIGGLAQRCEQYRKGNPIDVSVGSESARLEMLQKEYQSVLRNNIDARNKIQILAGLASGQAPQTVETAIERQQIKELVENYKWQRERVQMLGHP
jgi:hypothetical protein